MTDLNTLQLHAQTLIQRLNAPAQWHSVFIRTSVDPDTKQFVRELCVSVRPGKKVSVPTEHQGIPVVQVPWPKKGEIPDGWDLWCGSYWTDDGKNRPGPKKGE